MEYLLKQAMGFTSEDFDMEHVITPFLVVDALKHHFHVEAFQFGIFKFYLFQAMLLPINYENLVTLVRLTSLLLTLRSYGLFNQ